MKAGKVWGETSPVLRSPFCEVDLVTQFKAGMRCSRHRHEHKANLFLVVDGRLRVRVWQENGLVDVTELGPNEAMSVPPGLDHRFEGIEDGRMVEVYYPVMDAGDIVRKDCGGQTEAGEAGA